MTNKNQENNTAFLKEIYDKTLVSTKLKMKIVSLI